MKRERSPRLLFVICYLSYSALYVARMNFSVASALLQADGVLTTAQIGVIGSVFALTYAAFKIPGGYLGDRLSTGLVVALGLMLTGTSNLLIGFFPSFLPMALLWGMNAAGQALLWGPMVRAVTGAFGEDKAKITCTYLSTAVGTGSILGLLLAGRCASALGAAACFLLPGGIALGMAVVVRLFFGKNAGGQRQERLPLRVTLQLFREKSFRRVVAPALTHGMVKDNLNVFLGVYFLDRFSLDVGQLAGYIFLIPLMGLLGRLLYPVFFRVLKDENRVSAVGFLLTALALLPLFFPGVTAAAAMLCLSAVSALVSLINAQLVSVFPVRFAATKNVAFAASIMDLLIYGGAGIGALLFGAMIEHYGYLSMFAVWAAGSVFACILMLRARRLDENKEEIG